MTAEDESNQRIGNAIGMPPQEVAIFRSNLEASIEAKVLRAIFLDRIRQLYDEDINKLRRCGEDTRAKLQGGLDSFDRAIIQIQEKL